jgi:ABC-type transporter MlaC component
MRISPLIVATVFAATFAWLSAPVSAQTPKETVSSLVQTFTSWSGNVNDRSAYAEAAKLIDYQGMAQRSLSPAAWGKLSAKERSEFTGTLRTLIEQRYYTRWHRIFAKGKLTFTGETNVGSDTLVKSDLLLGKKTDTLEWRLDTVNGERKVVSLAVGQSDLLKKLSARLQGRVEKGGFNGLLTWMKSKANIGLNDNYEEASSPAKSQ